VAATVVLVHGAWHGAWCWEKVTERLADVGVPVLAIDLPGHGESREDLGDLRTDAAALTRALDGLDRAVVCGHSYGGAVIGEGADHPAVGHLIFIGAIVLAPGESCAASVTTDGELEPSALEGALRPGTDGTVTVDAAVAPAALYGDCSPTDVAAAVRRLGPQRMASLQTPATTAAWQRIPSTYALCADDRAIPPALQRAFADRTASVVEWPTSHSPFLSRPDLVAELLADRSRQVASEGRG
jgi:pimeloyl-ACP methyl ester carboxylesterase